DTAFRPLLMDFVIPAAKQFTEFLRGLRETNPEILKFGAGLTIVVAAASPLLAALGMVAGGLSNIIALSARAAPLLAKVMATGAGRGALAVAGGALAAGAG